MKYDSDLDRVPGLESGLYYKTLLMILYSEGGTKTFFPESIDYKLFIDITADGKDFTTIYKKNNEGNYVFSKILNGKNTIFL